MKRDAWHILHLKICQTRSFYKNVDDCILICLALISNWKGTRSGEEEIFKKKKKKSPAWNWGGRLEEAKDGDTKGRSSKLLGTRSRHGFYRRVENLAVSHCSYYLCMYESCTAAESVLFLLLQVTCSVCTFIYTQKSYSWHLCFPICFLLPSTFVSLETYHGICMSGFVLSEIKFVIIILHFR